MPAEIFGHTWKADFGQFAFQLEFHSDTSMSFRPFHADGSLGGAMTVEITRTELRPDLWLVSWDEPTLQNTVVHIQDFEKGLVWTHISSLRQQDFLRFKGHLTRWTGAQ